MIFNIYRRRLDSIVHYNLSAFSFTLMPDSRISKQPEIQLQFADGDREESSTLVEARNRRPKQHRLRFVRSKVVKVALRSRRGHSPESLHDPLDKLCSRARNASTWTSLKLAQIYDVQLDQRNLLHFVLSPGAEFPSSPGPGAYLSRLPKCAY